jgi:hypothetical protein
MKWTAIRGIDRNPNYDELVKTQSPVIPAEAGVQNYFKLLDFRLRGNDNLR